MRLRFLMVCCWLSCAHAAFAQAIPIAQARNLPEGTQITVRGVVINGSELGIIRYLQDGTAGIAAYPGTGSAPSFASIVAEGDSVEISGTLVYFHGLLEINPISAYHIIASNLPAPAALPLSLAAIPEDAESRLVEFECVQFGNSGGVFGGAGTYTLTDNAAGSGAVYLWFGHPLIGSDVPTQPLKIRAILSRYDDFQLLPRYTADFLPANCFYFAQTPQQSNIQSNGFTLDWQTNLAANCTLKIGLTPVPDLSIPITGSGPVFQYTFQNLNPGTIYWVQALAERNGVSIATAPRPLATRSLSSGQIKTYFNHGIDAGFANGLSADGETYEAVRDETIARIDAAQQTIDVAVYNNNRDDLVDALTAAQARGVRVRYVGTLDASNPALDPPPAFPVLLGNDNALMHNKFMVIDADLEQQAWVMSGSLNWTNQNMIYDFNNTLFIQDQSLARAYRLEFEEMWGSGDVQPDANNARFGSAKRDNTPHQFVIGGHAVESYFSPSDQTTSHISDALWSAQYESVFGAFSFTKNDIGDILIYQHGLGLDVRGIMENINDPGAEYDYLLNAGLPVKHHYLSGEFHHKYGIVDATHPDSDPLVITGSHNWTNAAETANDENTLILHHPDIATLFRAEFEKRWREFPLSAGHTYTQGIELFPNPATHTLYLRWTEPSHTPIRIFDAQGRLLHSRIPDAGEIQSFDLGGWPAGLYFLVISRNETTQTIPFQTVQH